MGRVTSSSGEPAPGPFTAFDRFYRETYETLVKRVMVAGGTWTQATDAADATMEDVFTRWTEIDNPRAYARRAVVSNFLKIKRLESRGRWRMQSAATAESEPGTEHGLNLWENKEAVMQILGTLPTAQRNVLALIVDGFSPTEIAELLGGTPQAVRKNLERARRRLRSDPYITAHRRRRRDASGSDVVSTDTDQAGGESV